jgi:hypothetical protein
MRCLGIVIVFLGTLLAACNSQTAVPPTPFPTLSGTLLPTQSGPAILTLTELAAAPGLYKDSQIQLTGQFHKQPLLICEAESFRSPATWGMIEEGVTVLAGGFDQQMRTLLPEGLMVTAEGRWRQWQGLEGCGKQARLQEIWYLDVSRILSPSPLTQVTLTPSTGEPGTSVAELPVESETEEPPEEEFIGTPVEELPATSEFEPSPGLPTLDLPETTPTLSSYPLGTPALTSTISQQETPSDQDLLETPTPEGTPTLGTPPATGTGTPGSVTPSPTSAGQGGPVIDQGNLLSPSVEFVSTTLEAGTIHGWSLDMYQGETFILSAIAPSPANLSLSLIKDGQTIIDRQNNSPAGSPEILTITASADIESYQVLVQADGGPRTDYAILTYLEEDFPTLSVAGMITPGSPQTNITVQVDSVHYWFFTAESGRNLSILASPDPQADPIFYLYGPGAEYIESIDNGFEGDEELFEGATTESGLYAIRIYEFNYSSMTYRLAVTVQ